jgi:putative transcriptional regulator
MANYESLQHIFLIAMPQMLDPDFTQSVVYIWEYDEHGATGVIVNKPMDARLGELLKQVNVKEMSWYAENYAILHGGPVAPDQAFIIRRQHHEMTDDEGNPLFEITISSARQDLIKLAITDWKHEAIVTLGCASWKPGQLDKELANNDWLVAPFSESTLFGSALEDMGNRSSVDVWYNAAARAGIDLKRLSTDAGHA